MKKIIFIITCLIVVKCSFSQAEYVTDSFKFEQKGVLYTYKSEVIKEKNMYKIMLGKNDSELNSVVKKAKRANKIQYLSYAAIPVGLLALESFALSELVKLIPANNNYGGLISTSEGYLVEGIIGSVATVALITTGVTFKMRNKKLKLKAVKLYNQKF